MAHPLLLDPATIRADHVVVDADAVGRMNPQCGGMRQLDHVVHLDHGTGLIAGIKHVRHDEFWVPLHIPGRPLMPGVLIIEAAAQLSSIYFLTKSDPGRFLGFARCTDVAFRGQVLPGDTLVLVAKEVSWSPRRFICDTQATVDGRLVYEGRITGMPI